MNIVVTSQSALKLAAVRAAFAATDTIIGVKAASGVAEQPLNDETMRGAFNRLADAKHLHPGADLYVSIENGLFEENGQYLDKAVAVVLDTGNGMDTGISDGVIFPSDCVEEARRRGFDTWTAGKVMAERGVIAKHDDPHATLAGKPRADYIAQALADALQARANRLAVRP